MSTFIGRFKYFVGVVDPSTLLYSDKDILHAAGELNKFRNTGVMPASNEKMWQYRAIADSAIHPTSGDILPRWFRMSSIGPINIPIVFGMLTCPSSNTLGTMLLHFVNQSYNTGCNYYNRSGADMTTREIGTAYMLAVGSACTIAYGLGKATARSSILKKFGVIIPCVATCAASVSNLALTRASEMTQGVPIVGGDGKVQRLTCECKLLIRRVSYKYQVLGNSKVAGVQGVLQSAVSRCVLVPCSVLLVPPVVMEMLKRYSPPVSPLFEHSHHYLITDCSPSYYERVNLFPKRSRLAILLAELGVIFASLMVALPASLAVFPQVRCQPTPVSTSDKWITVCLCYYCCCRHYC